MTLCDSFITVTVKHLARCFVGKPACDDLLQMAHFSCSVSIVGAQSDLIRGVKIDRVSGFTRLNLILLVTANTQ